MLRVLIWGSGGQGREVKSLCELLDIEVLGFLNELPDAKGAIIDECPVIGDIHEASSLKSEAAVICCGVGSTSLKAKFWRKTLQAGFSISKPIIHPDVRISRRNTIGGGAVIFGGVQITTNVTLGNNVFLNSNVCIGHDSILLDHVTVCPGACISGNVTVGQGTFIGAGSAIKEKVVIGSECLIGGGAFVTRDVPDGITVVGLPARKMKESL